MARRVPSMRLDLAVATASAVAVTGTLLSAVLVEALSDRDWSIGSWEWMDVAVLSAALTFGAFWLLLVLAPRVRGRRDGTTEPVSHSTPTPVERRVGTPTEGAPLRTPVAEGPRVTPRRVVGAAYRSVPRAPFRFLMPTTIWRGAFRFWLSVLAADPDARRGVTRLLVAYDDAYRAVDLAAIRYDDGVHVKHRLTRYHDFFIERVNAGERVLDIGSGKGEVAYDLVTISGAVVVGVDHDPGHLAFARSRFQHPDLAFQEGDVRESIPAGHFDVVVLSNVFEHLDDRVDFLRALMRSATPTRLLFRVPVYERDWTVPLRDEVGLSGFWDSDHRVEYTPETFTLELADAGLSVTELILRWGEIWAVARLRDATAQAGLERPR